MKFDLSRRGFLGGLAGFSIIGSGCCSANARVIAPGQKVRLAAVGMWGKGFSDWMPMVKSGLAELVALCDVDKGYLNNIAQNKDFQKLGIDLSKVPYYSDYRKLLDDAGKLGIDALTVSTPDHMHAAVAIRAMKMGIHCYVQKPLVRTLWEAKYFYKTAKKHGVVTQMGNQGSGGDGFRRNVEILQSGILGDVTEVHVWTNRPVWPQGKEVEKYVKSRTTGDVVPTNLNWDVWVGVQKQRPYLGDYPKGTDVYDPWGLGKHVYHSFTWRGFFDFGCGAFGDMACHTMNLPFRGLELAEVTNAECTKIVSENSVAYPLKSVVKMTYAARKSSARPGVKLPAVTLYWYDGDEKPSKDLMPQICAMDQFKGNVPGTGCLVIGTKGILCSCNDYGQEAFIALKGDKVAKDTNQHEACKAVAKTLTRCQGAAAGGMDTSAGAASLSADGHYIEFLTAIMEKGPTFRETNSRCYSDVEYSIPIMESILVGTVAQRLPNKALTWDSANQVFGEKDANAFYGFTPRKGFEF